MGNPHLTFKNLQSGQPETIVQCDLTQESWGFCFSVDSELKAYQTAYIYRHHPYGVNIEFAPGVRKWIVTVFNSEAHVIGIDGAKTTTLTFPMAQRPLDKDEGSIHMPKAKGHSATVSHGDQITMEISDSNNEPVLGVAIEIESDSPRVVVDTGQGSPAVIIRRNKDELVVDTGDREPAILKLVEG